MAISFVGSAEGQTVVGSTEHVTVTLPESMVENDVVFAWAHDRVNIPTVGSGYTQIGDNQTFNAGTANAWYKVMGPSPDDTLSTTHAGDNGFAKVLIVIVLRGVDTSNVLDTTSTIETGVVSANPDPPAITTVTNGAWVIPWMTTGLSDTTVTAPTGYINQVDINCNAAISDATSGGATREVAAAGVEDPSAWTGIASSTWACRTVAVRPAAVAAVGRSYGLIS